MKLMVSKLCKECVRCRVGDCIGKPQSKPGKLPCRFYQLDPQLVSDKDIEPGERPPSLKDRPKSNLSKQLVPVPILSTDKKKSANFVRLATQRLQATLDGMRKLGNLNNKASYEWVQEQIDVIVGRIRRAADELEKKF